MTISWSIYYHMATLSIIRVKRKLDESPAEALVVGAKRRKQLDDSETEENQNLVFIYAGTTSQEGQIRDTVNQAYKRQSLYKSRGYQSGNEKIERLFSRRSELISNESHRQNFVAKKRKIAEDLTIIDALENPEKIPDVNQNSVSVLPQTGASSNCNNNEVTCNGLTMIREKLNISSPSKYTNDGDDCFDLYYREMAEESGNGECSSTQATSSAAQTSCFNPLDIMYMVPYYSEQWASYMSEDEEETPHDDSDDSNCENNWRNDYPDSPNGGFGGNSSESGCSSEDEFGNEKPRRMKMKGMGFSSFGDCLSDPTDFFERYSEFVQSDDSDSIGSD